MDKFIQLPHLNNRICRSSALKLPAYEYILPSQNTLWNMKKPNTYSCNLGDSFGFKVTTSLWICITVVGNQQYHRLYSGVGIIFTNSFWHFMNLLVLSKSGLAWVVEDKFFWKTVCTLAFLVPARHHELTFCFGDLADILFLC